MARRRARSEKQVVRERLSAHEAAAIFEKARALWWPGRKANAAERKAALQKYRLAASTGIAKYQSALGQILINADQRDTYDFKAGYRCILDAAKNGAAGAQYWIARELATGENVRRNPQAAADWYRKASRRGNAEARYNLGIMYFEGDGVARNLAHAHRWITRAAEGGEILAIMLLSDAHKTGEMGFPIDPRRAARWRRRLDAFETKPQRSRRQARKLPA